MLPLRDELPTRTVPFVNYALVAANVIVFALEVGGVVNAEAWSVVPANFVADPSASWPTLFTHMFLHGGLEHIAGNMLFLWIFGDNVEDVLGHVRYALFYVTCGVCAALVQIAVAPSLQAPMLGASGAISGVLAAYGVLYPSSRILVVNPIPLLWFFWGFFLVFPAWLVIVEFFVANLLNAFGVGTGSGVAFVAHIGGFLTGLVLLPLLRARDRVDYDSWDRWLTDEGGPPGAHALHPPFG
jgi:membrane associated rhomboid family serine protease